VDYRDVLATVVGASVAGIVAFAIRLFFPINAAVLALIYAATYSLLWSIVGDHSKLLFHRYLPASTRLDGHWKLVTGSLAVVAAGAAGIIIAYALSRPASLVSTTPSTVSSLLTRTVRLQPRVVISKKTIVLPVQTQIVTTAAATVPGQTSTIISRTVIVQRPAVTVTVSSTQQARTVTQTTSAVTDTAPTAVTTTSDTSTLPFGATDTTPPTTPIATTPAP
jgi:hypothetical protein